MQSFSSSQSIRHGCRALASVFHPRNPRNGRFPSQKSQRKSNKEKLRFTSSSSPPRSSSDSLVYTRAIVHKVYTILRSTPWSDAMVALRALPVHRWDSFLVNRVLKTHPPMEKAWLFFRWADSALQGFKHDRFTYTTMLDIFGEAGRLASMCRVFREMEERGMAADAATYTSIAKWLAKAGDLDGAVAAWEEMRARGCRPTLVSYTALMKILFDHGRPDEAGTVYREMLEVGLSPNCHTYTVIMEYLAGVGKFKAALKIMDEMQEAGVEPDKATCNILIQKCSSFGETSTMRKILLYMKDNTIVLRRPVFLAAIEAFKDNNEIDNLLREVNPHLSSEGTEDNMNFETTYSDIASFIDRSVIVNLLARRNFIAIEHMLHRMMNMDIKFDSELMSSVIQISCANYVTSCAIMAFQYCSKVRKEIDRSAYTSLLGLLIRTNSFQMVLDVINEMIKSGVSIGAYLASLLIYRLGSGGFYASAANVFHSLPVDQNITTFTALIQASFRAGEVETGLQLFSQMREQGFPISSGTLEVLVLGLERCGRMHDAEMFRKEKRKLQWNKFSREKSALDESLCNCLFDAH